MKLLVNGKPHEHGGDGSLHALAGEMKASLDHLAVVVNGSVVPRANHRVFKLAEGDKVELIVFAAGG